MSASNQDIAITIISNEKESYYSSFKGFGNILWELDFGLYSDVKPDSDSIFNFAENTIWDDSIVTLESPLQNPTYGILTVDFDKKIITDQDGYGPFNVMNISWFIQCIFKYANEKSKNFDNNLMLTKKTITEHLKNGNIYIGDRFYKKTNLNLPKNINDTYDFFLKLGCEEHNLRPVSMIHKDYSWIQIETPNGWTIIE